MTLPQETRTRIEQQAKDYAQEKCKDLKFKKHIHRKTILMYAHQAGATEWAEKAQGLLDALEAIAGKTMPVPNKADMIEIAKAAIAKYKEVGNG